MEARATEVLCWAGLKRLAELGATGAGVGTASAGVGDAGVDALGDGVVIFGLEIVGLLIELWLCDPPQLQPAGA